MVMLESLAIWHVRESGLIHGQRSSFGVYLKLLL